MDAPRILLAALVAATAAACGEPPTDVVLVTMDTTRQDVLGVYGGQARTPALARLAADGVGCPRPPGAGVLVGSQLPAAAGVGGGGEGRFEAVGALTSTNGKTAYRGPDAGKQSRIRTIGYDF